MVGNLIISLVVLLVSGFTYITYKHPELYREKYDGKLFYFGMCQLIFSQLYDFTILFTFSAFKEFVAERKVDLAREALDKIEAPMYIPLAGGAAFIYSFFLSWFSF